MQKPFCDYCEARLTADDASFVCAACLKRFDEEAAQEEFEMRIEGERGARAAYWLSWRWLSTEDWRWILPSVFVDWCLGTFEAHEPPTFGR